MRRNGQPFLGRRAMMQPHPLQDIELAEYPVIQKPLSPQMTRVLACLSRGLTYEQIAAELGITRHTVSSYVQHIFERLGVRTKTEAVVIGIKGGMI
jgi:DNA-binding NarL/FixJ family response regulator